MIRKLIRKIKRMFRKSKPTDNMSTEEIVTKAQMMVYEEKMKRMYKDAEDILESFRKQGVK